MKEYQVIEDNGGGLYLFVFNEKGQVVNGFPNLEHLSPDEFASSIFAVENNGDVTDWEGGFDSPQAAYDELTSFKFGWELVGDQEKNYPERMGRAAQLAYGF